MSWNFGQMRDDITSIARIVDATRKSQVETMIKTEYQKLWYSKPWKFVRAETHIQTVAPKTTGTISITAGASAVVGVGTSFAATDVGAYLWPGTHVSPLQVLTFTDTTHITTEPYLGTTDLSGVTYKLYRWRYSLPADFDRPVTSQEPNNLIDLNWLSETHFRFLHPFPRIEGNIGDLCVIWDAVTPYLYVHPVPSKATLIPLVYRKAVTLPTADGSSFYLPDIAQSYLFNKCSARVHLEVKQDINLYNSWMAEVIGDYMQLISLHLDATEKVIMDYPGRNRHDTSDTEGYYRTNPRSKSYWGL